MDEIVRILTKIYPKVRFWVVESDYNIINYDDESLQRDANFLNLVGLLDMGFMEGQQLLVAYEHQYNY